MKIRKKKRAASARTASFLIRFNLTLFEKENSLEMANFH
jgi:hypothetical protein